MVFPWVLFLNDADCFIKCDSTAIFSHQLREDDDLYFSLQVTQVSLLLKKREDLNIDPVLGRKGKGSNRPLESRGYSDSHHVGRVLKP